METTTTKPHGLRSLSSVARAARDVRAALKAAFPGVRFTVRSESFSMGSSVGIGWTDGPTTHAVEAIAGRFEEGSFDGMTDSYTYSAEDSATPNRAKYVTCHRQISQEIRASVRANIEALLTGSADRWDDRTQQVLGDADLTHGYAGVVFGDDGEFQIVEGRAA